MTDDVGFSRYHDIKKRPFSADSLSVVVSLILCVSGGAFLTGGLALLHIQYFNVGISFLSVASVLLALGALVIILACAGVLRKGHIVITKTRLVQLNMVPEMLAGSSQLYEPRRTPDTSLDLSFSSVGGESSCSDLSLCSTPPLILTPRHQGATFTPSSDYWHSGDVHLSPPQLPTGALQAAPTGTGHRHWRNRDFGSDLGLLRGAASTAATPGELALWRQSAPPAGGDWGGETGAPSGGD